MPLVHLIRLPITLLSWAILIGAGYLLWRWYDGTVVLDPNGVAHRIRADWMLWTGLLLFAVSALGKLFWAPLLAKPDSGKPSSAERGAGQRIHGAGGASLYVESHGPADAHPILLIHGAGADSTFWNYARDELSKRFRVIVWDLPGYGLTKGGTVDLSSFAANLLSVIAFAGGRAVVVGHSVGGMTIQTLARNLPDLFERHVSGVVLLNTTYTNPLKTMILPRLAQALRPLLEVSFHLQIWLQPLAWLSAWQSYLSGAAHLANRVTMGPTATRSQLNHVTLMGTRNPPASIARSNLAMFRWDATGALAGVSAPVLILGGAGDIVTKPEASATLQQMSPTSRLRILEDANHMSPLDQASTYNAAILAFAEEVSASSAVPQRTPKQPAPSVT